ncbi:hypothetical protein ANO11243_000780 [Dothideomycetidae sp. 11243]|nr:hypothetical protein ANO11243_000780 [fungal sp. No.11243]
MLDVPGDNAPDPKCYFTHVRLPQHIDHQQPPTKKKPFSCILERPFNQTVDILGPDDTIRVLRDKLQPVTAGLRYARVHMKLLDLVQGDFFNTYIKQGNIAMLSGGKPGVDNTFSFHDGILRLQLDRPTYERAGLTGKPIMSPGRKHSKYRYLIELNLRLPSIVRGKPGFNRIIYAFRNALVDTVTWLFIDLNNLTLDPSIPLPSKSPADRSANDEEKPDSETPSAPKQAPISTFSPLVKEVTTTLHLLPSRYIPFFPTSLPATDTTTLTEWLEYLTIALLDAPCLQSSHTSNPTLNRYGPPDLLPMDTDRDFAACSVGDLARLRMRGLVPAPSVAEVLAHCVEAVGADSGGDDKAPSPWIAFRVQGIDGGTCLAFLCGREAWVWEYET